MAQEIEVDLEATVSMRHWGCCETAGGNVERDVPPVIHQWRQRHANLADYLRPHVERRVGFPPLIDRQRRPLI